jgi:ADP-L-glycero-D-manno-heptose 6-epimerase
MALPNNDHILVTGGAGFIGSALVWALNERGVENIIVCDRLGADEKWRNLAPLRFSDYIDADELLSKAERSEGFLGNVSTVYHMGACSDTREADAGYLMRNNFEFTKRLAHWALKKRARFVYASSAATYGDGSLGMSDTDPNVERFRPLNAYAYAKYLFDCYLKKRGILNNVVGVKYFNVFGPNEDHKGQMRSMVSKAYEQIVATGKVTLFKSDGEQMRDFLYVKDAADMTIHLANRPLSGGLFNVGSGVASTWLQLVSAVFHTIGRQPNIEYVEMPVEWKGKSPDHSCADTKKLMESGYQRMPTDLSVAVHDYMANYLIPGNRLGDK